MCACRCPSADELDQLLLRTVLICRAAGSDWGSLLWTAALGLRVDCLMLLQGERPGALLGWIVIREALLGRLPEEGLCAGGYGGLGEQGGGTQLGDLPQCPPRLGKCPLPLPLPRVTGLRRGVACQESQSLPGSEEETSRRPPGELGKWVCAAQN